MEYVEVDKFGADSERTETPKTVSTSHHFSHQNDFGSTSWESQYMPGSYKKKGKCRRICFGFIIVLLLVAGAAVYLYGNPLDYQPMIRGSVQDEKTSP
jgi:hypothetical protein